MANEVARKLPPISRSALIRCSSALSTAAFGLVIFGLVSVRAPDARAQSNWDFPEFKQATDAYRSGDCQTAWDLMWPLAKGGSHEARYFLWSVVGVGRVIPPGHALWDYATTLHHMLTLAAYAAAAPQGPKPFQGDPNHRWARAEIPLLIAGLKLGAPGDRVAQCYKSGSSFRDCLNLAVRLGVVQRFEDYADQLDIEARETDRPASCRPRP